MHPSGPNYAIIFTIPVDNFFSYHSVEFSASTFSRSLAILFQQVLSLGLLFIGLSLLLKTPLQSLCQFITDHYNLWHKNFQPFTWSNIAYFNLIFCLLLYAKIEPEDNARQHYSEFFDLVMSRFCTFSARDFAQKGF